MKLIFEEQIPQTLIRNLGAKLATSSGIFESVWG